MIGKTNEFGFVFFAFAIYLLSYWLLLVYSDALLERIASSQIFRYLELKIKSFLAMRRYRREKKEWLKQLDRSYTAILADHQKK